MLVRPASMGPVETQSVPSRVMMKDRWDAAWQRRFDLAEDLHASRLVVRDVQDLIFHPGKPIPADRSAVRIDL